MRLHFHRYSHAKELYRAAAEYVCRAAAEDIAARGRLILALAGGQTPRPLYELLGMAPYRKSIPWDRVRILWGDERCVPRDHPDSNARMAYEALIERVPIPEENVVRVPAEERDPESIARAYERMVREAAGVDEDGWPRLDLVLLGMGVDGHTASLFPGDAAATETNRAVVAVDGAEGAPPVPRITMTVPLINNARRVAFIVAGADKLRVIDDIRDDPAASAEKYPAALIHPRDELTWFVME